MNDADTKVCVISAQLAAANNLNVGDSILLSIGTKCYVSDAKMETAGIESGMPGGGNVEQELCRMDEAYEEYEIVGLYSFIDRDLFKSYYAYSYNDVFVPKTNIFDNVDYEARPYNYTFCISGKDYDSFLDTVENDLMKLGYVISVTESDWTEVQGIYAEMQNRYWFNMIGAVVAFGLVVFAYTAMLIMLYRKEFGLRLMFGADKKEVNRSVLTPFWLTAIPGFLIPLIVSYICFSEMLQNRLQKIAPDCSVRNSEILAVLLIIAVIGIAMAYLVLRILIVIQQKKSLQKILL